MPVLSRFCLVAALVASGCATDEAQPSNFEGPAFNPPSSRDGDAGSRQDTRSGTDAGTVDEDGGLEACELTCAGCCDEEGVCQDGSETAVCGLGGAACGDCGTDRCREGICETAGCTEDSDCEAGFLCGPENVCALDPESRWSVTVGVLTVDLRKDDGSGWDRGDDEPDPFVELWLASGDDGRTEHHENTDMVEYNEVTHEDVASEDLVGTMTVEVRDNDRFQRDDTMVRHDFEVTEEHLRDGVIHIERERTTEASQLLLELRFDAI